MQVLLLACLCLLPTYGQAQRMSLNGKWSVSLSLNASDGQCGFEVALPGTTDTNGIGILPSDTTETTRLTRRHSYVGVAAYRREIVVPKAWRHRPVMLCMERTKPTRVYVDGILIDSCSAISTPQRYLLPPMRPGRHVLTVAVDNAHGVPPQLYASSHAYTEDTQTNWNGILGDIYLEPQDSGKGRKDMMRYGALAGVAREYSGRMLPCFRDFHADGTSLYANGHRVFLRGKHDACVWPLTGHVPMDVASWVKYFSTCQNYGINHVRFHSWCPPEAAFVAADSLGIYLQPELPFWGDFDEKDTVLMTFLHEEGVRILQEYGHHPSFRMMALGNELWGSVAAMRQFVDDFRKICPDKLYTFGSNYYLGYQGIQEGMDYFTTCRIGGEAWGTYSTHTRGSFSFADAYDGGVINHCHPATTYNFDEACDKATVPIISHETGQFQIYPDYRETQKYAGVLHPYNMEVFRRRLSAAGMGGQADGFFRASGLWAVQLYKADIEMDLRTRGMAGFQLLDLQDYPGQGSAYVGVLDAFMESKGLVRPEEWRQWCSPVVPLLVISRFCFEDGDTLSARVQVANYGGTSLAGKTLRWTLGVHTGTLTVPEGEGLLDVGTIVCVPRASRARKDTLTLSVEGTDAHNTYALWFYPKRVAGGSEIVIADDLTPDICRQLERGARVLWMPTRSSTFSVQSDSTHTDKCATPYTVGPLFTTDYWNYRMFKTICENNKKEPSPGTLGILVDPSHPVFADFPTEMHSDWQWFPVLKNAHPLVLDNFGDSCQPLVQVIDNVERNHRLGILMEWRVGKGRLLVCMSDLWKASEWPEGKAFFASVLHYMRSESFDPRQALSLHELSTLLSEKPQTVTLRELNNISPY